MKNDFHGPEGHLEEDEKELEDAQKKGRDFDSIFWKPKTGTLDDNVIRILPGIGGAKYHLKHGRHFINHGENDIESFVCNLETHGENCLACEKYEELLRAGKKQEARVYRPSVRGTFNVIDRNDPESGVKLWESPKSVIWERVVGIVRGRGRWSNMVGTKENPLEGRDMGIAFNPKANPNNMYTFQLLDTTPLSEDAEEIQRWLGEARPLIAEKIYPPVSKEEAEIKMYGSLEEREELKEVLRLQREESSEEDDEPEFVKEADNVSEGKGKEDEIAELKKKLADAEARARESEKEESSEESEKEEENTEEEEDKSEEKKEEEEKPKKTVEEKKPEKETSTGNGKKKSNVPEDTLKKIKSIQDKYKKKASE